MRAFPNKYPALPPEEGVHEVIVNTPRHVSSLVDLTSDEAIRAVGAWAERLDAVAADPRGLVPFLFLNQGAPAGASLQHTHAQLAGLPFVPPRLARRREAFAAAPRCPICVDIAGGDGRIVSEDDGLVTWCPEVPPLSGAVRIAPRRHTPSWGEGVDAPALARGLHRLAGRLEDGFGTSALNVWLHEERGAEGPTFHWHVEAIPRVGTLAGLELGTGVIAALYTPEATAARLRSV